MFSFILLYSLVVANPFPEYYATNPSRWEDNDQSSAHPNPIQYVQTESDLALSDLNPDETSSADEYRIPTEWDTGVLKPIIPVTDLNEQGTCFCG